MVSWYGRNENFRYIDFKFRRVRIPKKHSYVMKPPDHSNLETLCVTCYYHFPVSGQTFKLPNNREFLRIPWLPTKVSSPQEIFSRKKLFSFQPIHFIKRIIVWVSFKCSSRSSAKEGKHFTGSHYVKYVLTSAAVQRELWVPSWQMLLFCYWENVVGR